MGTKSKITGTLYRNFVKPVAFCFDPELVHNSFTRLGEALSGSKILSSLYSSTYPNLEKKVLGVSFKNPIGLAAGFDYDGHLAAAMKDIGFGFNTVGTVTARAYAGNEKPRLVRMPRSRSILVNKGFKSEGAKAVAARLDKKDLENHTIGISVGSSNTPQVDTIKKAIDDYLFTFDLFKRKKYVSYFELNISCPNTTMPESFTSKDNFKKLIKEISMLHLNKPIFVKMPSEIDFPGAEAIVRAALERDIQGFIFSNLVKNRTNQFLDLEEVDKIKELKGNFSGKPTFTQSNKLISMARKKFGKDIAIVGCGGVFSPMDALEKLKCGADLVQLITGMIFEGPQLIEEICEVLNDRIPQGGTSDSFSW